VLGRLTVLAGSFTAGVLLLAASLGLAARVFMEIAGT
jgi:hypothetical protein